MKFARRVRSLKRLLPWWRVSASPHILLTFDDGPHAEHTPAVLERLAQFHLAAAFFLVGNRITDPRLVQRITDEGHLLGNHTFSHAIPKWSDTALSLADVSRCQELIPNAKLFRPPLGKLTPALWLAARRHGLRIVNWSLDSGDWRCRSEADAETCAAEVLELVRPGDVVLFHDDHRWIGHILDIVLPSLTTRFSPPTARLSA
ncbi:MAG: polysaccharide deacetylase family protein [Gemmataceae bacterium]